MNFVIHSPTNWVQKEWQEYEAVSSLSCWLNCPEQKTGQRRTNEEEGEEEVNELKQKHGDGGRRE